MDWCRPGARGPVSILGRLMFRACQVSQKRSGRDAVLIIGVHREELAFGDKVVGGLDPSLADLLRIEYQASANEAAF